MTATTLTAQAAGADLKAELRELLERLDGGTLDLDELRGMADRLTAVLRRTRGRITTLAKRVEPEPDKPAGEPKVHAIAEPEQNIAETRKVSPEPEPPKAIEPEPERRPPPKAAIPVPERTPPAAPAVPPVAAPGRRVPAVLLAVLAVCALVGRTIWSGILRGVSWAGRRSRRGRDAPTRPQVHRSGARRRSPQA